jgi:hypothetical protein
VVFILLPKYGPRQIISCENADTSLMVAALVSKYCPDLV